MPATSNRSMMMCDEHMGDSYMGVQFIREIAIPSFYNMFLFCFICLHHWLDVVLSWSCRSVISNRTKENMLLFSCFILSAAHYSYGRYNIALLKCAGYFFSEAVQSSRSLTSVLSPVEISGA